MKLLVAVLFATASTVTYADLSLRAPYAVSSLSTSAGPVVTHSFGGYGNTTVVNGAAVEQTVIGANGSAVPYLTVSSTSNDVNAGSGSAIAQLQYSWGLIGTAAVGEYVPVTITTSGYIQTNYGFEAYPQYQGYNLIASYARAAMVSTFDTTTDQGRDLRSYGLGTGGIYFGGTYVTWPVIAQGSSGSSSVDRYFEETFTLLVAPNVDNRIFMYAQADIYVNSSSTSRYALEWYNSTAYIDPIIQIDPQFSSRFSLVQSAIPIFPVSNNVPEPSSIALLLAALGILGIVVKTKENRA